MKKSLLLATFMIVAGYSICEAQYHYVDYPAYFGGVPPFAECRIQISDDAYIPQVNHLEDGTIVLSSSVPEWNDILKNYHFTGFYSFPTPYEEDSTSHLWKLYGFAFELDAEKNAFLEDIQRKFQEQMPLAENGSYFPNKACDIQIHDSAYIPVCRVIEAKSVELSSSVPEWDEVLKFFHFEGWWKFTTMDHGSFLGEIYCFGLTSHAECFSFMTIIQEKFHEPMPLVETNSDEFKVIPEGLHDISPALSADGTFNVLGQEVDDSYHGIVIQNGKKKLQ